MMNFEGVLPPEEQLGNSEQEDTLETVVKEFELSSVGLEELKVLEGFERRRGELHNLSTDKIEAFSKEFSDFSHDMEEMGEDTSKILLDHFMLGLDIENGEIEKFDTDNGDYAKFIDWLFTKYGV